MKQMQFCLILVLLCGLPVLAQKQKPLLAQKQKKEERTDKAVPPVAAAPAVSPWRNEEAKFSGHAVTLAGTFTFPKTVTPKQTPAILLIGGYGAVPRDGIAVTPTVLQPIYQQFAEHFAAQGFLTFRFDKRCAGQSTCTETVSFDDLIDDAKAALELLRARPEVDAAKIMLFGHSEGGQVASIIAASDAKLAGLMLAASPGRTLNKILREDAVNRMRESKASAEQIAAFTKKFDQFARAVTSGNLDPASMAFNDQDPNDVMMKKLVKQPAYAVSTFINDPLQVLQGTATPVLLLHGEKDLFITASDARFLNESLARTHHPDTTYKSFADVDHLFKTNKGPATIALSQDVKQPLDAEVLAALSEWLAKRK